MSVEQRLFDLEAIDDTGSSVPFYPFSIRTGTMRALNGDDRAYNDFRNHLIEVAYDNGAELAHRMGYHQQRAGHAIKTLIKLVTSEGLTPLSDPILEARVKGIELHPGRGISFTNPERVAQAVNTRGRVAAAETIYIDPLLIAYAHSLTNSLPTNEELDS